VEKASEFELRTTSLYVLCLYICAKLDDSLHKILVEHYARNRLEDPPSD
jgi:hypothetical protein